MNADRPMRGRDLAQARRVEHGAIGLRWLVVAFGVAEAAFALRDTGDTPGYALPLSFILVAGLAIGNVVVSTAAERATRLEQLERIGFLGFALDVVVVIGLIWTSSVGPADPIWVIGYVLPLEGAIRWGLRGALAPIPVFLVSEIFREISLSDRYASHPFMGGAVAFRVGMGLTVAIVSGLMARSLEREAEKARERARAAEDTAELAERSARRETEARRRGRGLPRRDPRRRRRRQRRREHPIDGHRSGATSSADRSPCCSSTPTTTAATLPRRQGCPRRPRLRPRERLPLDGPERVARRDVGTARAAGRALRGRRPPSR